MREVDRLAEDEFGLAPLQLMEMAGLAVARAAREILDPPLAGKAIVILAGPGNNGADGMVAARRLMGWGARVSLVLSYPEATGRGLSIGQLRAALAAGVQLHVDASGAKAAIESADLLVDALLGFGARGEPNGRVADLVLAANAAPAPTLAIDLPSGMDAETGHQSGTCIRATATLTLALPKTGLLAEGARSVTGRLLLADLGIPPRLLERIGISAESLFQFGDLVEV